MHRTETVDRYLETVYYIAGEGELVRPSRIADWLNVSAPTVSVALQRLARDGWIEIAGNRSVALTEAGHSAAASIVRRHRLLERWLTDVLGFDWVAADAEAERLAPGVSELVLASLDEALGQPSTCPHGNTIPGRDAPYGELVALADLEPDVHAMVQRISEVAEHEAPELLHQLAGYGVRPGVELRIAAEDGAAGALAVSVGERTMALSTATARLIWVEIIAPRGV
jgi:DtxR family Mn-dependent transcriptional regulator